MVGTLNEFEVQMRVQDEKAYLGTQIAMPKILSEILESQKYDQEVAFIKAQIESSEAMPGWEIHTDGSLKYQGRMCIPSDNSLREKVLKEFHHLVFTVHPGGRNEKGCSKVCVSVPDMSTSKGRTSKIGRNTSTLTNSRVEMRTHNHGFRDGSSNTLDSLSRLFIKEVIRLHGVPVSIVSDRDPRFTSQFWQSLQKAMGTNLCFSTTFHPQTDGQSERTIQTLEDMLRACVMDFKGSWKKHLPLIEFTYNNSFQANIGMTPYEALYGRPSQSRQKSYVDQRRRPLTFEVGDHVFLKVRPRRGATRFGKKGKLAPQYVGPFEILSKVGEVVYRLALPPQLVGVHNVFHISMLRKYEPHPSHIINWEEINLDEDVTFEEKPIKILDRREEELRGKSIPFVRVL
ncbi:uncharacterized protein LOC114306104 [Camellia sinensis]|uniref:uncharacterized protein LOC114306104 n=1 Tax=Camellia sinensis TaxID=4442 RepID=UPI0010364684|nr:uncharacterized protein LOC114306104 [Camellia sinensis]